MASVASRVGVRSRRSSWGPVLLVLLGLALPGCGSVRRAEAASPEADPSGLADPVLLKQDLELFASRALADIAGTASSIAAATDDRRIREQTLRWKIDMAERLSAAAALPDSRRGFLELWLTMARESYSLREGRQNALFGDQQQKAVDAIERQLQHVRELGHAHFPAQIVDAASDDVQQAAAGAVLETSPFATPSSGVSALGLATDVGRLLTVPLSPFRGVADAPTAIGQLAASTDSFTAMTRTLPRRTRWELELLLLDMESLGSVAAVRDGVQRVTQTIERLSALMESLPAEIRAEIDAAAQALKENQPELHATVVEARQTVAELNEGLTRAQGVLQKASEVGGEMSVAAESWEKTAAAVGKLLADWRAYQESLPPRQPDEDGATVADYAEVAKEVQQAAAETRALLNEVRQTARDSATMGQVSAEMTRLMNALTLRLVLLVGVVFIAVVALRVVWRRMGRNSRESDGTNPQA